MCITATTSNGMAQQQQQPKSFNSSRISNAGILRGLYIATTFLCGFMVLWILVFPSSWLVGRSTLHDDLLIKAMTSHPPSQGVVPIELVTKYKGHAAIHLSHTLPGVIWAGAVPFQLHPAMRKRYPQTHRIMGRVFIATSMLMMAGVAIILKRGLMYEEFFSDLPPPNFSTLPGIVLQSAWFLVTAIVSTLQARAKKFASHQRFIIRHVASGIWISLQRILLMTVFNRPPFTRMQQRAVFGDAGFLAIFVCFVCGELAIRLLGNEGNKKKIQ